MDTFITIGKTFNISECFLLFPPECFTCIVIQSLQWPSGVGVIVIHILKMKTNKQTNQKTKPKTQNTWSTD